MNTVARPSHTNTCITVLGSLLLLLPVCPCAARCLSRGPARARRLCNWWLWCLSPAARQSSTSTTSTLERWATAGSACRKYNKFCSEPRQSLSRTDSDCWSRLLARQPMCSACAMETAGQRALACLWFVGLPAVHGPLMLVRSFTNTYRFTKIAGLNCKALLLNAGVCCDACRTSCTESTVC